MIWVLILLVLLLSVGVYPPVGVYRGGSELTGILLAVCLVLVVLALMGRL